MSSYDIICSVPGDIIRAIIAAAGVDDSITIRTWKVYRNEYYGIAKSNYELILQRRCLDKITRLVFSDDMYKEDYPYDSKRYPDNIDMMMHFGKFFNDEAGKKDMDLLDIVRRGTLYNINGEAHCQYSCDQYGNRILYNTDELNGICRNASTRIVSKLAALCPNVTHLFLRFLHPTVTNNVLADIFVNSNMKQLVKLECNVPVANLMLRDGNNLYSLALGNYDIDCGQSSQLPSNLIKNLSLSFEGGFSWDLFKRGDIAPTPYDNLTRLELGGNDRAINKIANDLAEESLSAENPPMAVFPRLQTLVIRHKILSYTSLKHILQFPVKVLRIDGNMKHAFQLYEHDLGNIDMLILKFDNYYFVDDDVFRAEFIQPSNKLLAKTANISEVHFELDINFVTVYWNETSWVHLTHFYVEVSMDVGQIFTAISKMPNLIYLSIFVHAHTKDIFNDVLRFINEHGRDNTKPIQSKIKDVVITCMYEDPSTELSNALEFLKWYLPELEKLIVVGG